VAANKRYAGVTISERFWKKVEQRGPGECWPWSGATNPQGYGQLWDGTRKRPAHRIAWEILHGQPFPEGMDACHTCDNPGCVNPQHIFPGTPRDNAMDSMAKGRAHIPPRVTACRRGHALTAENSYVTPSGHVHCRECRRLRQRVEWTRRVLAQFPRKEQP